MSSNLPNPLEYKEEFLRRLDVNFLRTSPEELEKFSEIPPFLLDGFMREAYHPDAQGSINWFPCSPINTTIIGAGGVASWFLPQYLKTLYNKRSKSEINLTYTVYLVDNDDVEEKNLLRQNFIPEDVGQNKAQVLAERYNLVYEGIQVKAVPKYFYSPPFLAAFAPESRSHFNRDNFIFNASLLHSDIVINTLDNELSKHMVDFELDRLRAKYYFSAGCHQHGGTITALNTAYDLYSNYYRDETFVEDGGEIETFSCAELAETLTVEQTFDSNSVAATLLNVVINNYVSDPLYTVKKVAFNSTGIPYTQVLDDEVSLKYSRFKILLNLKLKELWLYLRTRDFKFANSAKGRTLKSFVETWQPYYDIEALIQTWKDLGRFQKI